jgi:hypothetical protein
MTSVGIVKSVVKEDQNRTFNDFIMLSELQAKMHIKLDLILRLV